MKLRGAQVGVLRLSLAQWDQLRADCGGAKVPPWLSAIAHAARIEAERA